MEAEDCEPEGVCVHTDDSVPSLPARVRNVSAKRFRTFSIICRKK